MVPIKICDVIQFHSPLSGGIKRYVTDKARFFADRQDVEHCVIVPGARDGVQAYGRSRFYSIRSVPLVGAVGYRLLLSRWKILRILESETPHIVEIGDPYYSAWVALEYARKAKIPTVGYYHSDFPRALGRTVRKYFGPTSARLASVYVHGYLRRLYTRMDATAAATAKGCTILGKLGVRGTRIIPLGMDPETFRPQGGRDSMRQKLGVSGSSRLILYVGRLAWEKHVNGLIPMMDLLRRRGVHGHLLFVGDGPLRSKLEKASLSRPYVSLLPFCTSRERLAHIYSAADLCVYPGTSETFGYVAAEAQACGTPVLVVAGGGADDILTGERRPIVARSPDPEDLAQAAYEALQAPESDSSRWERHRRMVTHFSWNRTFLTLLELYRELAEAPLSGSRDG
ncbi:alpha-1,6-mannosyltransferase [Desulfacinum hydrothermale DSM 13146]|uniref:Alpha-1,6-mannosyltransferase n=1 Tax=Desulfacinum hydrothermale DSM 13146 TaxID=1121390 RepID=A0A1W1XIR6_9BACT|nr:glycosyltransferase [Desulfacinum hydrothermale]SMC23664.1 alpha-1,6-mannosyltransferase [Desulfacinum hydrothermale DSM 13146]